MRTTQKLILVLAMACCAVPRTSAFAPALNTKSTCAHTPLHMSTAAPPVTITTPSHVASALKKPSKTLTVGMEYSPQQDLGVGEIGTLSMQARKLKATTLWTNDKMAAQEFVKEQKGAQGNFPGPCPVVWNAKSLDSVEEGMELGVDAVVLPASASTTDDSGLTQKLADKETGAIWQVESEEDVSNVLSSQGEEGATICFLADGENDNLDGILEAIPSQSITLVSMPSMQDDNAELTTSKALKQQGVHGIVLKQAIVGDAEDVEYISFAVEGLTKKQSSTFNMSGLTGSTNGHFGGVSSSVAKTWRRIVYADSKQ